MKLILILGSLLSSSVFATGLAAPICALGLLASSLGSVGPLTPAQVLESHSTMIVDQLVKTGIPNLAKLDLKKLAAQIREVKWSDDPTAAMPAIVSTRTSAVCYPHRYEVTVKSLPSDADRGDVEMFALHEALCAAGYADLDYEMSSYMANLRDSGRKDVASDDRLIRAIFEWPMLIVEPKLQLAGGGITSTGGGGDLTAQKIKLAALNLLASRVNLDESFVTAWLVTPFEPNEVVSAVGAETLDIRREFLPGIFGGGRSQLKWLVKTHSGQWPRSAYVGFGQWIQLSIPTKTWLENPQAREKILEDIIAVMTSLFVQTRTEVPERVFRLAKEITLVPTIKSPLVASRQLELIDWSFREYFRINDRRFPAVPFNQMVPP